MMVLVFNGSGVATTLANGARRFRACVGDPGIAVDIGASTVSKGPSTEMWRYLAQQYDS